MSVITNKDTIWDELQQVLKIKNKSIFDFVDISLYYGDFMFFYQLACAINQEHNDEKCKEIGLLSQIIHLSSLIHIEVAQKSETFRPLDQSVQYPILIGDLLYGKFIKILTEQKNLHYFAAYSNYLRRVNGVIVDSKVEDTEELHRAQCRLLGETTGHLVYERIQKGQVLEPQWIEVAVLAGEYYSIMVRSNDAERLQVCWEMIVEKIGYIENAKKGRILLEKMNHLLLKQLPQFNVSVGSIVQLQELLVDK